MSLKRTRQRRSRGSALTLVGWIAAGAWMPLPASGEEVPYVGVWVVELRNCGAPPADPNSPMEISRDGYDQHLTHCTFKSVEPHEGDYAIAAECSINGKVKMSSITLTASGNTLTFVDETGARDFLRCQ